jgi:hypothetical protein
MHIAKYSILIIMLVFYFMEHANAALKSTAMGGVTGVLNDGYVDASRNPALLPFEKSNTSWGIAGHYIPFRRVNFKEEDVTVDIGEEETVSQSSELQYGAGFSTGCIWGSRRSFYGLHLHHSETAMCTKTESESDVSFYFPALSAYSIQNEKSEEKTFNPSLSLAYGYNLTGSSAVGLQCELAYNAQEIEKDLVQLTDYTTPTPTEEVQSHAKEEIESYSASLAIGYLFNDPVDRSQFGVLLSLGTLRWYRSNLEYTYEDITGGTDGDDSDSLSYVEYTRGPSLLVSFLIPAGNTVRLAVEIGVQYSVTYTQKELDTNDDDHTVAQSTQEMKSPYITIANLGCEWLVYDQLSLMGGASMILYSQESQKEVDSQLKNNIYVVRATFGVEYSITEHLLFNLVAMYSYWYAEGEFEEDVILLEQQNNIHQVDLYTAFTHYL